MSPSKQGFRLASSRRLATWLTVLCLLFVATAAYAFSITITKNLKQMVGPSRHVNMEGTYTLSAGETALTSVQIVTLDSSRRFLSSAGGSFTGSTWKAGVGDFALAYYYVEFRVRTSTGATQVYRTATFTW